MMAEFFTDIFAEMNLLSVLVLWNGKVCEAQGNG
jgi:hypothetical protein